MHSDKLLKSVWVTTGVTICLCGLLLAVPATAGIWDDAKKKFGVGDKTETDSTSLTDDQIV